VKIKSKIFWDSIALNKYLWKNIAFKMMNNRELFFRHLGISSQSPVALEISHAKGIYLYDEKGKEYIDLISGVSVSNTGHSHPQIISAITGQINKYMHLMVYGEYIQSPQVQLAKALTDLLPDNLDSVYFVNSGSEAIEGALKLAKRFTGRSEIVAFNNAYHGSTHGALSITGNELLKNSFRPLLPDIRFLEFNNFDDLVNITEGTSCVIAEAIQAEAGVILPFSGYLKALADRCHETGTLMILDDVQMGFGRTGKLFSFENFDFVPDILVLAKGMGGGMPIGAFISSKNIMNTLTFEPELGHITTFGGHPVCSAAALANLKILSEGKIFIDAQEKGKLFKSELKNYHHIKDIRQFGLLLGIDLAFDTLAEKLLKAFLSNGLLSDRFLFRPNAFRIAPPLNISFSEIEKAISQIKKSLDQI
jgi:acetylornithine/succinyldiaminopimelate/putrescine aminotransferase